MPLLALEESPYFVSLYDSTRRGRLEQAAKLPLYPFVYAWLLILERWRGWSGRGLRLKGLTARPGRLEATLHVGRLLPSHHFTVRAETIERLVFVVGPEGERELSLTVRVRYRSRAGRSLRGEASFGVVDVDTQREAMSVILRMARKLGCATYRILPDGDEAGLAVELLVPEEDVGARGYRDRARPVDVRPVPDEDEVTDLRPREHGGFVEPEGENIPAPDPDRVGIAVFEPGKRVVAGGRPRPLLLALLPLLVIGWVVLWLVAVLVLGAGVGLVGSIVSIAASLVGIDTWWLVLHEASSALIVLASAIVALFYVVPPAVVLLGEAFGSRVTIDWETGYVERRGAFARLITPIGHVRGVDVRASIGTRRLLLRTTEGDVTLASGNDALTPIAVVLARSLDVPVSLPPS